MNLFEVAERVSRIASEKGFDKADWDENFVQKLAFVITELDEAVQGAKGIGKDPVELELADVAIRLLACLYGVSGTSWSPGRIEGRRSPERIGVWQPIEVAVWPILRKVSEAIECWRKNDPEIGRKDAMICCELALLETFRLADRMGIDLLSIIELKTIANAARPHLHGKGRSVG